MNNKERKLKKVPNKSHRTVTELKNTLQRFNHRLDEVGQRSRLEDKAMELTQTEKQEEKIILKNEGILRDC